ncbi:MAG: SDR family oxidoreductase, partial [Phycisphaerae bacterium]|nr:SDR family oxidoreductase [Phycisphaerae bacterium]
ALGDSRQKEFSSHLRSRQETAQVLRESEVPVTEFRAGIIIGQGSLSFEMIRALTERIPLMVCPRWVFQRTQPIAMDDVMTYLVQALDTPESTGQIVEIGGEHVLTYGELMLGYARERGLRRYLIPVPVLTPRLSSYWVHWTTPIAAAMAKPLIEGLRSEVVVRNDAAARLFPQIACRDYGTAVREVLADLRPDAYEAVMAKALESPQGVGACFDQGMIVEVCQAAVNAKPEALYQAFCDLGSQGWGLWHWAWWLLAQIDRCLGGIGFRKGRPEGRPLQVNDHLDFFSVDHVVPDRILRLEVDMKLPGQGWLEFRARPVTPETTQLVQTVYFAPKGLWGLVYWYGLHPMHRLIFASLLRQLKDRAESDLKTSV